MSSTPTYFLHYLVVRHRIAIFRASILSESRGRFVVVTFVVLLAVFFSTGRVLELLLAIRLRVIVEVMTRVTCGGEDFCRSLVSIASLCRALSSEIIIEKVSRPTGAKLQQNCIDSP